MALSAQTRQNLDDAITACLREVIAQNPDAGPDEVLMEASWVVGIEGSVLQSGHSGPMFYRYIASSESGTPAQTLGLSELLHQQLKNECLSHVV